jgi:hypothetical protein
MKTNNNEKSRWGKPNLPGAYIVHLKDMSRWETTATFAKNEYEPLGKTPGTFARMMRVFYEPHFCQQTNQRS